MLPLYQVSLSYVGLLFMNVGQTQDTYQWMQSAIRSFWAAVEHTETFTSTELNSRQGFDGTAERDSNSTDSNCFSIDQTLCGSWSKYLMPRIFSCNQTKQHSPPTWISG